MPESVGALFSAQMQHFVTLAVVLFCLGLYTTLTRVNSVALLMGVELILNAANILFAAFQRFLFPLLYVRGQVMAVFVILLAAAEAAVALGIVIALYQNVKTADVSAATNLRE